MVRPNPLQWIWYAYGGTLPQRYREWVLRDITARTWLIRHTIRTLMFVVPILVVLYLIFGLAVHLPASILWPAMALGVIVGLYYSLSYARETGDLRLVKYGYPDGHGTQLRDKRNEGATEQRERNYEARWRTQD